jgi:hypothetical protein
MSAKGSDIKFIGGKYNGRSGWRVAGKADSAKQVHVIVDMGHGLKVTRVNKENVRNVASQQLSSQRTPKSSTERKGHEIVFVGGKYKGHTGWRNTAKNETDQCVHVIINIGDELLETLVYKRSVQDLNNCDKNFCETSMLKRKALAKALQFVLLVENTKGKADGYMD